MGGGSKLYKTVLVPVGTGLVLPGLCQGQGQSSGWGLPGLAVRGGTTLTVFVHSSVSVIVCVFLFPFLVCGKLAQPTSSAFFSQFSPRGVRGRREWPSSSLVPAEAEPWQKCKKFSCCKKTHVNNVLSF